MYIVHTFAKFSGWWTLQSNVFKRRQWRSSILQWHFMLSKLVCSLHCTWLWCGCGLPSPTGVFSELHIAGWHKNSKANPTNTTQIQFFSSMRSWGNSNCRYEKIATKYGWIHRERVFKKAHLCKENTSVVVVVVGAFLLCPIFSVLGSIREDKEEE